MEDKNTFEYSIEKIRLETLTTISLIPQFVASLDERYRKAKRAGKEGIFLNLDEIECANVSCTQITGTLQKCYELLLHSSKHQDAQIKILNRILFEDLKQQKAG